MPDELSTLKLNHIQLLSGFPTPFTQQEKAPYPPHSSEFPLRGNKQQFSILFFYNPTTPWMHFTSLIPLGQMAWNKTDCNLVCGPGGWKSQSPLQVQHCIAGDSSHPWKPFGNIWDSLACFARSKNFGTQSSLHASTQACPVEGRELCDCPGGVLWKSHAKIWSYPGTCVAVPTWEESTL